MLDHWSLPSWPMADGSDADYAALFNAQSRNSAVIARDLRIIANLFTIIASARLHQLDPELYLTELFRVLAQWPRDRYLELSPKYWARTRARLDPQELAREYGRITIPPPLDLRSAATIG